MLGIYYCMEEEKILPTALAAKANVLHIYKSYKILKGDSTFTLNDYKQQAYYLEKIFHSPESFSYQAIDQKCN